MGSQRVLMGGLVAMGLVCLSGLSACGGYADSEAYGDEPLGPVEGIEDHEIASRSRARAGAAAVVVRKVAVSVCAGK